MAIICSTTNYYKSVSAKIVHFALTICFNVHFVGVFAVYTHSKCDSQMSRRFALLYFYSRTFTSVGVNLYANCHSFVTGSWI